MRNVRIILLLFLLIAIPLVYGKALPQSTVGDISHEIRWGGGIPPADTSCNITISFRNDTKLVDFDPMTRSSNGNYYNYTLNSSQTSIVGEYPYEITCSSSGENRTEAFTLFVNSGGIEPSGTKTDSISRTIYIMFAMAILFFFAFLFTGENLTFKYTFFLLFLIFFIITVNFLFIGLQDDVVNPSVQNFFSFFTASSFYMLIFFGVLLGFLWIVSIIVTLLSIKKARKEFKFGGDFD